MGIAATRSPSASRQRRVAPGAERTPDCNRTILNASSMNTGDSQMKNLKRILILLTGGLMALNTFAADAPDRPLHVLYLGPVNVGSGGRGGGFGGSRTNYVYLPGQSLAPEAIYFDQLSNPTNLTEKYLSHFDAVVQVMPDAEVGAALQKML